MSFDGPHIFGDNLGDILGPSLYTSSKESVREGVANSLDSGARRVEITIDHKLVSIEDWGKGIQDPIQFKMLGQSKNERKDFERIGWWDVGKMSLLRLGDRVDVVSNVLDQISYRLPYTKNGFEGTEQRIPAQGLLLSHPGTKFSIANPHRSQLPEPKELLRFLSKAFGLWLHQYPDLVISVNGERVPAPKNLLVDKVEGRLKAHHICTLKGDRKVLGYIIEHEKGEGMIDVYIERVFIQTVQMSNHRIKGWVNCSKDAISPTTDRSRVNIDTDGFRDLKEHVSEYCRRRGFPVITVNNSPTKDGPTPKVITAIQSIVDKYSKLFADKISLPKVFDEVRNKRDVRLLGTEDDPVESGRVLGNNNDPSKTFTGKDTSFVHVGDGQVTLQTPKEETVLVRTRKKGQGEKSKSNIMIVTRAFLGKPAMWTEHGSSIIYINSSHDLYKRYWNNNDDRYLGPKSARYAAQLAHLLAQMQYTYSGKSDEERQALIDDIEVFVLKELGLI